MPEHQLHSLLSLLPFPSPVSGNTIWQVILSSCEMTYSGELNLMIMGRTKLRYPACSSHAPNHQNFLNFTLTHRQGSTAL